MTDTFEATLARIVSQKSDFQSLDERAVEIGAVLPLLRRVGWDTENVLEIYPQYGLPDGTKVDYHLRIDGESRILIEVKNWGHTLNDEDEDQLLGYVRSAKPKIAALTSGRRWRLFLPPTRQNRQLRRFHEFDITTEQPTEVAKTFGRFLARDRMVNSKSAVDAARKMHRESQEFENFKKEFTEAWGELASDSNAFAELVLEFAKKKGISTNPANAMHFVESLDQPLVNEVATTVERLPRPASFTLPTWPTKSNVGTRKLNKGHKSWNKLLLRICELMKERHPESFSQNLLLITDRFAENKDSKFNLPVGDTGIYTTWAGGAKGFKDTCYAIVTKFGYTRDTFVIRDSKGVRVP